MRILYKLASRSRPDKFRRTVQSIFDNSLSMNFVITAAVDEDDHTLPEYPSSDECGLKLVYNYGFSNNKVEAINRGVPTEGELGYWHILVNVSDDQVFIKKGFDKIIWAQFIDSPDLPCNLDRFIHFPDQSPAGPILPTMSIMGRTYYDRFKYIYHPDYWSLWCDDEARDVAMQLGKYKFTQERIYDHEHPFWTQQPTDELGKRNEALYRQDQRTYNKRKALGFPKESIFS